MDLQFNCPDTGKVYNIYSDLELCSLLDSGVLNVNARVYDSDTGRLAKLFQLKALEAVLKPYIDKGKSREAADSKESAMGADAYRFPESTTLNAAEYFKDQGKMKEVDYFQDKDELKEVDYFQDKNKMKEVDYFQNKEEMKEIGYFQDKDELKEVDYFQQNFLAEAEIAETQGSTKVSAAILEEKPTPVSISSELPRRQVIIPTDKTLPPSLHAVVIPESRKATLPEVTVPNTMAANPLVHKPLSVKTHLAIGLVTIFCIGGFFAGFLDAKMSLSGSNSSFENIIPNFAGKMAVVAFFSFVSIFSILIHKKSPDLRKHIRHGMIFSFIYLLVQSSMLNTTLQQVTLIRAQDKATQEKVSELYGKLIKNERPPKIKYEESVYGKNANIITSFSDFIIENEKDNENLTAMAEEIGKVNPVAIVNNKEEYAKVQAKIKECITQYQQIYTKQLEYKKRQKQIMDALVINAEEKKNLSQKSEVNSNEFNTLYKQYIDNEILVLNTVNKMYEYIKNNNGKKFIVTNGQLQFYDNKELIEFGKFSKDLDAMVKKEDEYLKTLNKMQLEIFDKMNSQKN